MTRTLKTILLITLMLAFRAGFAGAGSNNTDDLTTALQREITSYVIQQLGLSEQDLLLEIGQSRTELKSGLLWDQIQILPGRRPVSKGLQLLRCGVFLDGRLQQSLDVKVRVRTFQDVVASAALLGRHETILPEHLVISRRETTTLGQPVFTKIEDVAGMWAKMVIRTGQIITENLVEILPLIRSGSPVKVYFRSEGLEVTMPGVAQQDGFANARVRVKCRDTKKSYTAVVQDAHAVVVHF